MNKIPYFPFYPGDWWRDTAIQSLGHFEKGVLIDLLSIMFDNDGQLTLNGRPYPLEALSKRLGIDTDTMRNSLDILIQYGCLKQTKEGVYYSEWIGESIRNTAKLRKKKAPTFDNSPTNNEENADKTPTDYRQNADNSPKNSKGDADKMPTKDRPSISYSNNNIINKQQNAGARTRTREGHMPDDAEQAVAMAFGKTEASEEFIRQAFYQAAALDFQDGRGNQIRNWPAHVQAFWNNSRNKERKETARLEAMKKRPASANRTSSALVPAEGIIKANC